MSNLLTTGSVLAAFFAAGFAVMGLVVLAFAAVFVYATLRNRPRKAEPPFTLQDDDPQDPDSETDPSSRRDTTGQPSIQR